MTDPGGRPGPSGRRGFRGCLPLAFLVVLALVAGAPRLPAPELAPPAVAAEPSPPAAGEAALPGVDLESLWEGPFLRAWTWLPPARPFLSLVPALRVLGDRLVEAPLLHVIRPLEGLRGLRFRHPVPWTVKRPDEVRTFMAEILERDYPVERSDFDGLLLRRLGLVPEGFALRSFLLGLMAEQVQGAYDPKVGWFFVVLQEKNWLSRLVRSGGPDEGELVALHELDHALEDQHFDLEALQEALARPRNTDREMGLQALVEGDATLVMMQHSLVLQGGDPEQVASVGWISGLVGGLPGMGEFGRAPLYFQRSLLLPYCGGMDLVNLVRQQGGWAAVNRMYQDPPQSTEQVLHPEKYLRRDPPRPWLRRA